LLDQTDSSANDSVAADSDTSPARERAVLQR